MEIEIKNLQKKIPLNSLQIAKIAKTILRYERVTRATLALVFVTSPKIRSLNRKYLRRDYATDVLAFDSKEGGGSRVLQGDIVISVDAAVRNARIYKTALARELALYIIHGILHLHGYDDHGYAQTRKMRAREAKLLGHLDTRIINRIVS